MNTSRDMKDKEYKQSLIEEFGEIEANKILSMDGLMLQVLVVCFQNVNH